MASPSDSAGGAGGGGRAGAELMVPQFLLKALHAILAVRVPRSPAPAPAPAALRRRDRWFHLPLHAPPSAERLPEPSPREPLVVDVYLAPAGGGGGGPEEVVVERWSVACEAWPSPASGEGMAVNRAYKRCITLLRSLYAALCVLPAYRAFRALSAASGQQYNYEMGHRVGSFATPFSRAEEAALRTRSFGPVETQLGRLVSPYSTFPASPPSISRSPPSRQPRSSRITSAAPQPSPRAPSRPRSRRQPARPFRRPRGARTAGRRLRPGPTRRGSKPSFRRRPHITRRPRPRRPLLPVAPSIRGSATSTRLHQ